MWVHIRKIISFLKGKGAEKSRRLGLLLVLPSTLWIIAFILYPILYNVWLSFTSFSLLTSPTYDFVGLRNFNRLFLNPEFWAALQNSFIWTFSCVALEIIFGLAIALILNEKLKFSAFFRGAVIVPWLIPTVAAAFIWTWIYNDQFGLINYILILLGITKQPIVWLGSVNYSMIVLIFTGVWKAVPFSALMLLAGLQGIREEFYEVAKLDGASKIGRFWYITLPFLSPIIAILILMKFIWYFNWFDMIWLMTRGGPGNITTTIPILIYRTTFLQYRFGEGSAMVVVTSIMLILFLILATKVIWRGSETR